MKLHTYLLIVLFDDPHEYHIEQNTFFAIFKMSVILVFISQVTVLFVLKPIYVSFLYIVSFIFHVTAFNALCKTL